MHTGSMSVSGLYKSIPILAKHWDLLYMLWANTTMVFAVVMVQPRRQANRKSHVHSIIFSTATKATYYV